MQRNTGEYSGVRVLSGAGWDTRICIPLLGRWTSRANWSTVAKKSGLWATVSAYSEYSQPSQSILSTAYSQLEV